ncbi:E3 ubiquitin-protein ligase TRAIP isoform X2 [Ooceraea biroi]|uniref:E3 ubiquitin-protein ligase TRAIP isoform X2 n=1 Tax=Ooceraea biroi TaxID=2015173 RepID=UPI0005B8EA92|nr:E3 ubiquitin-protein ligase TRAIP isoform X2 [Ooceraea biroi]
MNILCNICQELLTPSDTLLVIYCGHLFHNNCLTRWLKRSATCPQCRQEATEGKIHKVYFTHENDKTITEIADFALEEQVNNLKFQILLKEKDINFYTTKSANLEKQNVGLRQLVREVESEIKQKNSIIQDLMEKIVDLQKIQLECASFKKRLSEKEKELQEYREKESAKVAKDQVKPHQEQCTLDQEENQEVAKVRERSKNEPDHEHNHVNNSDSRRKSAEETSSRSKKRQYYLLHARNLHFLNKG